MDWQITIHIPEYTDLNGMHYEESTETFVCPYRSGELVYYAFKEKKFLRKPKWVIRKSEVYSVWATNTFGVKLDNDWCIHKSDFNKLFTDREEAIEFCLKKNRQQKVKIYNKDWR